jgi:hypothetical protein
MNKEIRKPGLEGQAQDIRENTLRSLSTHHNAWCSNMLLRDVACKLAAL